MFVGATRNDKLSGIQMTEHENSELMAADEIEFARWETPFENNEIEILSILYGSGGLSSREFRKGDATGILYESPEIYPTQGRDLLVRLFDRDTESIYQVTFHDVSAYRVLDEAGLAHYQEGNGHPNTSVSLATLRAGSRISTLRIRNHPWSKECPLSFLETIVGEWTFDIWSRCECLEVACLVEPKVEFIEKVLPKEIPASDFEDQYFPKE